MFFIQMTIWTPKGELFWGKLLENNRKQEEKTMNLLEFAMIQNLIIG